MRTFWGVFAFAPYIYAIFAKNTPLFATKYGKKRVLILAKVPKYALKNHKFFHKKLKKLGKYSCNFKNGVLY